MSICIDVLTGQNVEHSSTSSTSSSNFYKFNNVYFPEKIITIQPSFLYRIAKIVSDDKKVDDSLKTLNQQTEFSIHTYRNWNIFPIVDMCIISYFTKRSIKLLDARGVKGFNIPKEFNSRYTSFDGYITCDDYHVITLFKPFDNILSENYLEHTGGVFDSVKLDNITKSFNELMFIEQPFYKPPPKPMCLKNEKIIVNKKV